MGRVENLPQKRSGDMESDVSASKAGQRVRFGRREKLATARGKRAVIGVCCIGCAARSASSPVRFAASQISSTGHLELGCRDRVVPFFFFYFEFVIYRFRYQVQFFFFTFLFENKQHALLK